jgi:predicted HicB family RNase H-like nuclease
MRLGSELHRELAVDALRVQESLNTYCVKLLKKRPRD